MSRRDRRDGDRRPGERRDSQPDDEQQRRPADQPDLQESDSLTALKAILAKVAALLEPMKLAPEESVKLVGQLYESVLEMDLMLAGEADDRRKSSIQAHIQNIAVVRGPDNKLKVEFPVIETPPAEAAPAAEAAATTQEAEPAAEAAPTAQAAPAAEAPAETQAADPPAETPPPRPRPPRPRPAPPEVAANEEPVVSTETGEPESE